MRKAVTPEKRREYNDRWIAKNPEGARTAQRKYDAANKDRNRRHHLKRACFTPELFMMVLEVQDHRCAICETDFLLMPTNQVHSDHCHEELRPRGVLCVRCNTGLGSFLDRPDLLERAAEYLRAPTILPGVRVDG